MAFPSVYIGLFWVYVCGSFGCDHKALLNIGTALLSVATAASDAYIGLFCVYT